MTLLDLKGNDELFNQRSIQIFIQLMWQEYQWAIIKGPLSQYLINLAVLVLLTSFGSLSYLDNLPVCNETSERNSNKYFDMSNGDRGEDCVSEPHGDTYSLQTLYYLNLLFCIITSFFVALNFGRELRQLINIGSLIDYISQLWNTFDMIQALCEGLYMIFMFDILLHKKEHE